MGSVTTSPLTVIWERKEISSVYQKKSLSDAKETEYGQIVSKLRKSSNLTILNPLKPAGQRTNRIHKTLFQNNKIYRTTSVGFGGRPTLAMVRSFCTWWSRTQSESQLFKS